MLLFPLVPPLLDDSIVMALAVEGLSGVASCGGTRAVVADEEQEPST